MWGKVFYKLLKMSDETKELILEVLCTIWSEHRMALFTIIGVFIAYRMYKNNKKKELREAWNSVGKDMVVLHGFRRSKVNPSLSPFVLKLETYLRMADIKYEFDSSTPRGPKGKTPWITLNGEDIADSQIIIERLGLHFNKDFSNHLTTEQKGATKGLSIMVDEHLFWGLEWWYFIADKEVQSLSMTDMPSIAKYFVFIPRRHMRNALNKQGLGRHSDAEIQGFIRKDLKALSQYLGNKKFLGGDTPCESDCNAFGMLSQFYWAMPGNPWKPFITDELPNLVDYCERMKTKFWPDWNSCLLK